MVGSPFWMAPEMIKKVPHGMPVDIWSYGICLLELANGHPPHRRASMLAMFTAATTGYPEPFEKRKVDRSERFKQYVNRCLVVDHEQRETAKQLLDDPFLDQEIGSEDLKELFKNLFVTNRLRMDSF
eukprot:TRINITY_DN5444_c0_g1_i1.p1 TRINITY_DN5444_c0_g1~~TRINITY_DN5444_c0_g1_i1.p1  ORF type:complete len:127 (-),score=30.13 TRINITY_DN5444_c0_g1_i1:51-431(-)